MMYENGTLIAANRISAPIGRTRPVAGGPTGRIAGTGITQGNAPAVTAQNNNGTDTDLIDSIPTSLPILLVDDEPQVLRSVSLLLRSSGVKQVLSVADSREVLPALADQPVAAILLDLAMPHISGRQLLDSIVSEFPEVPVIIITATNEVETAVECLRNGAFDYLVKPVDNDQLLVSLKRAMKVRSLQDEVTNLRESFLETEVRNKEAFAGIITCDPAMSAIFRYLEAIATSTQPVLVTGETGTGKELIAGAIHQLSGRSGEFIPVDSAGLDDQLFADTLFGHKPGAFTHATGERQGLISSARAGTLFLDEIGDLSTASQVKLLRLFQENTYYPLGSDRPHRSNARFIVATNLDLARRVEAGAFRKDLYYRLRAHWVKLPPLRERKGDIHLLFGHFLQEAALALNKKVPSVPPELETLLTNYYWPGNIRELKAMVYDAVARHVKGILSLQTFRDLISTAGGPDDRRALGDKTLSNVAKLFPDRIPTLKEAEAFLIEEAMRRAKNNQGTAAAMLGLTRQALNKRLVRRKNNGITD